MLTAAVTGSVLQAESFAEAPIRMEAEITAEANLQPAIKNMGVRFDRSGKAKVRISGTVAAPILR